MIKINQIKLPVTHSDEALKKKIIKMLKLNAKTGFTYRILKKSLDARKKPELFYTYSVAVEIEDTKNSEEAIVKRAASSSVLIYKEKEYMIPACGHIPLDRRPVIAGAGPAGLFCAYILAEAGFRPIVIERGSRVEKRTCDVQKFWESGILNPKSNVQFGEGGAGTFSDGKLNTSVKDPSGRNRLVLETFVRFGADPSILYDNKPHIGTDVLSEVIVNMREFLVDKGVTFVFDTCVNNLDIVSQKLLSVYTDSDSNSNSEIKTDVCVLALGHSARDTFEMLEREKFLMQAKSFAVGLRIEHPQSMINLALYGEEENEKLGAAAYKVTHTCENGRGVYSFCMCPGGYVVNASSEPDRLAVNGMSYHDRAGHNSNTALITTVTPDDFPSDSPLAGLEFQRKYEELAYKIGNGKIPVQLLGDFLKNQMSTKLGNVTPSIKGEWQFANLHECLPDYVCASLEEGMRAFGHKIKGYDAEDTVFSGVETRTSSPLRMERNKQFESNIQGLFPCGEGAGYAGGITSAAMDGIKTAEAIAEKILTQN